MVVEAFGALLSKAFQDGLLEGFSIGQGVLVSHLQFVDDTFIFCINSSNQLRLLKCVIKCFKVVSGLKVNMCNSRIFEIDQVSNLRDLTEVLGFQMVHLPSTYLGLPLRSSFKHKEVWNPILARIQNRLRGWKGIYPIFASLPMYFLSLLVVAALVADLIERCKGISFGGIERSYWSPSHCLG